MTPAISRKVSAMSMCLLYRGLIFAHWKLTSSFHWKLISYLFHPVKILWKISKWWKCLKCFRKMLKIKYCKRRLFKVKLSNGTLITGSPHCLKYGKMQAFCDPYFPVYGQNCVRIFAYMDRISDLYRKIHGTCMRKNGYNFVHVKENTDQSYAGIFLPDFWPKPICI